MCLIFIFFVPILKTKIKQKVKNLSLALNIVLLIAVGVLFYLFFANKGQEPQKEQNANPSSDYAIGYINADSVLQNYDFFIEMQEKLQKKTQELEGEYQNRAQGLQKEVSDYQRNVNSLTIGQAKAVEESLMKKQQNLRTYQESLTQELMQEEAKINKELFDKISSFLKDYSKNNELQMVVKFNPGSDVLFATEGMDITQAVITGLNNTYKNERNAGATESGTDTTASK